MAYDPRWLLICDVDGTVVHETDDATPQATQDTARLAAHVEAHRNELAFALNSGRFPASVLQTVGVSALPEPDVVIGGVGTQMQLVRRRDPLNRRLAALDQLYEERLRARYDADRVRGVALTFDGVEAQPQEFQSHYKTSFYWHHASDSQLDAMRSALASHNQAADLVYSSERDLDVLPVGIDKAEACRFLVETGNFDPECVVVCGDTGNDKAMLTAGYRAVVVGNAVSDLEDVTGDRIYRAQGFAAAGVLEGLKHWQQA